jgi:Fe-S cluster biosynthesis and repair protein YggX
MSGDLGRQVYESICADCWQEWIRMGTMVINELGLELRSQEAQQVYDDHMKEFLRLES